MKNFGLLILGIILGALFMYFYCCNDQVTMDSEPPTITTNGIITAKKASDLDIAYNIKHRIINDSLFKGSKDGGDNRSSWWSIDDIQNYINHAEHQSGELGYTLNGLRVYLGSYPSDGNNKTGLTTMFFVPTGFKNTSKGSIINMAVEGNGDIPGGDGLNHGGNGVPPGINYPQ